MNQVSEASSMSLGNGSSQANVSPCRGAGKLTFSANEPLLVRSCLLSSARVARSRAACCGGGCHLVSGLRAGQTRLCMRVPVASRPSLQSGESVDFCTAASLARGHCQPVIADLKSPVNLGSHASKSLLHLALREDSRPSTASGKSRMTSTVPAGEVPVGS